MILHHSFWLTQLIHLILKNTTPLILIRILKHTQLPYQNGGKNHEKMKHSIHSPQNKQRQRSHQWNESDFICSNKPQNITK